MKKDNLILTLLEKDGEEYEVKCSSVSYSTTHLSVHFADDITVLVKNENIEAFNIIFAKREKKWG